MSFNITEKIMLVRKIENYDQIIKMANDLSFGDKNTKALTGKLITETDPDEMINILETCREIIFENSGDDKLILATTHLVDFVQVNLAIKAMKGRNAH